MATRYDYTGLDSRLIKVEQQLHLARQETVGSRRLRKEQTEAFNKLSGEVVMLRQQLDEKGANPYLAGLISSLEGEVDRRFAEVEIRLIKVEEGQMTIGEDLRNHAQATNSELAELAVNDHMHTEAIQSISVRLDGASASAATANARLDERDNVPWWTVVVALVAGFFAGLAVNAKDFANYPSWAEQWWVPVVTGVLVAGFVFGLLLIVFGRHRSHAVSTSSASANASIAPVPVASAPKPVTAKGAPATANASA